MTKEKLEYERPVCDLCQKRPGDIKQEGVVFCASCFDAYSPRVVHVTQAQ